MWINKNQLVAAVASWKEHARQSVVAFQEGVGSDDNPFTSDLCVASIWRESDRLLERLGAAGGTAEIRVTVSSADKVNATSKALFMPVVSLRFVGGRREGDPSVMYLTVRAASILQVQKQIDDLREIGAEVRDWIYTA